VLDLYILNKVNRSETVKTSQIERPVSTKCDFSPINRKNLYPGIIYNWQVGVCAQVLSYAPGIKNSYSGTMWTKILVNFTNFHKLRSSTMWRNNFPGQLVSIKIAILCPVRPGEQRRPAHRGYTGSTFTRNGTCHWTTSASLFFIFLFGFDILLGHFHQVEGVYRSCSR
jgi:hypothetical protein